ncbi:MAG: EamA family transporter [Spirochaetes bacterium]|nr:EamA family transporter [Spirochaetota bacterium]
MKKNFVPILVSYFAIYTIWGSTYLAIRWSVESLPPFYVVGIRFFLSGLVFLLVSVASGKLKRFPSVKELLSAAFLAVFLLLCGNGFVSVGETSVDSYIAAIIISSTPFCVAFFNRVIFKEKLSATRLAGMALGLAGVAALMYDGRAARFTLSYGMLFIVVGFLSWGFGTSMSRALAVHPDNFVNSGLEWTMAGAAALVVSQFIYAPLPEVLPPVTPRSWWGLLYLTTVGASALAAYNYLLKNEPSSRIVSYAIVNPLIAVLLGILLAGEKPVPLLAVGMPVIIAGLVLMLYGDALAAAISARLGKADGKRPWTP